MGAPSDDTDDRPIGVFDSGVGGLTVLRALLDALPAEQLLYLGDTARVPYGTKSPQVVERYAIANGRFLTERGVKLVVVACNTASAVALPAMQARLGVPVIGVIDPGARAAVQVSAGRRIGVIGTQGTIASGAYQRALRALVPEPRHLEVFAQACPLFVPLAEEGWLTGEVPKLVAQRYLAPLEEARVDTLVLGCTHYPLLERVIASVMGTGVTLVDSATATAQTVREELARTSRLSARSGAPAHRCYVTDVPARFAEVGARFLGSALPEAEQVDISVSVPEALG